MRFRGPAWVILVAAAILGVGVAPALASTAQLVELSVYERCDIHPQACDPPRPPETALVYLGGGEANRVTLAPGAQIRISDPAARIVPGPGCSRVDDHTVNCAVPRALSYVSTGAGSDRVTSELGSASKLTVDGGAGNDVLVGGAGPDALLGGRGADRLSGRGGSDRLFDASSSRPLRGGDQAPRSGGSDVFFGDAFVRPIVAPGRGRDSFDGGGGNDTLSYQGRRERLRINLASSRRIAGARGERDSIRRVENATGGGGADRIAGDRRANRLLGEAEPYGESPGGGDRIAGRGGADSIAGLLGRNVLSGGPGNDKITLGLAESGERVVCGRGADTVATPVPKDFLDGDCEKPLLAGLIDGVLAPPTLRSRLPLRKGRPPNVLSGTLNCFLDNACQAILELRVEGPGSRRGTSPRRGTLLGSQSFAIGPGETKSFDLPVSPAGLRLLRRHRALRIRIVIATARSHPHPHGYLTLLRAT